MRYNCSATLKWLWEGLLLISKALAWHTINPRFIPDHLQFKKEVGDAKDLTLKTFEILYQSK